MVQETWELDIPAMEGEEPQDYVERVLAQQDTEVRSSIESMVNETWELDIKAEEDEWPADYVNRVLGQQHSEVLSSIESMVNMNWKLDIKAEEGEAPEEPPWGVLAAPGGLRGASWRLLWGPGRLLVLDGSWVLSCSFLAAPGRFWPFRWV